MLREDEQLTQYPVTQTGATPLAPTGLEKRKSPVHQEPGSCAQLLKFSCTRRGAAKQSPEEAADLAFLPNYEKRYCRKDG
jgi:hypothetical protein